MDKRHDEQTYQEELNSVQTDEGSAFILERVQSLIGDRSSDQSGSGYDKNPSEREGGQQ